MSRINTNVQSMIAQRVLSNNQSTLSTSLERLSTGLKINRGKDDPAGLIASQNLAVEQKVPGAEHLGHATPADAVDDLVPVVDEGGVPVRHKNLVRLPVRAERLSAQGNQGIRRVIVVAIITERQ